MRPIVDGLEQQFGEDVAFVYLNAREGEGEVIFDHLTLPGHPAVVLFSTDRHETFRALGPVEEVILREAILAQLPTP